ncbi:rab-GTPase-TBC domain-containing protein [Mortierella sp. GBAus27b]|nr:rab-GTPase-TBC domain-containing protein [Mortierella sp. GBAus27b]
MLLTSSSLTAGQQEQHHQHQHQPQHQQHQQLRQSLTGMQTRSTHSSSPHRNYHSPIHNTRSSSVSSSTSTSASTSPRRSSHRQEESAITLEEYEEILSAEVLVEVPKLREYARYGIPREVRGEAWLFLLGIQDADRSKEVSTQRQRMQDFEQLDKEPNESSKRVRGEISRYLRKTRIESSRDIPRLFEEVISAYCNHNHHIEYYPAMVNLCAPFVYSIKREWNAYLCFEKMINMLDEHFNEESVNEAVAKFMTLFHTCIPDLYSYFEEEEVDIKEWAASALQFVLSRELPLENTMRLWDTYFATPEAGWMDLHPFACLAILKHLKDSFEDLEQSEIRTMLMRLPQMDMDRIINEAFNLRHEILERQISDGGL